MTAEQAASFGLATCRDGSEEGLRCCDGEERNASHEPHVMPQCNCG